MALAYKGGRGREFDFAPLNDDPLTVPTMGNDTLTGTSGPDVIDGLDGDDTISGLDGADVLIGGLGADTLTGGTGADRFVFRSAAESPNGPGHDVVTDFVSGLDTLDFSLAGSGRITIERVGANTLVYFGDVSGETSAGLVRLTNGFAQGFDLLGGDAGVTLRGDTGANVLTGHLGEDIIYGNGGADRIDGREGADTLYGGDGADRFIVSDAAHSTLENPDVVMDFVAGSDDLDFDALVTSGYTDITLTRSGSQTFAYFAQPGQAPAGLVQVNALIDARDIRLNGLNLDVTINGTDAGETLYGGEENDVVNGGGGSDTLYGGNEGDDVLNGGGGDDRLRGGVTGNDTLNGGDGVDTAFYTQSRNAYIVTDNGDGTFSVYFNGSDFFDTLISVEFIEFSDQTIAISPSGPVTGTAGSDTLFGGAGNDVIYGLGGSDDLRGFQGDDFIEGGAGGDSINGGSGSDTASYASSDGAVRVRLFAGTAEFNHAAGDNLVSIENLIGSAFNDQLAGDAGDNIMEGGAGADTMGGREGFDTLSYASSNAGVVLNLANRTSSGGDAQGDVFTTAFEGVIGSAFNDLLNGGNGDQTIEGGLGNDRMNGGNGHDTLSYRLATTGVTVDLGVTTAQATGMGNDTITGFEAVTGSAFSDSLTGDGGDNRLIGGAGADALNGAGGSDTADYSASTGAVSINLAAGTASGGDAAGDTLTSIENLVGTALGDVLTGDGVDNILTGGAGGDALNGGGGDDTAVYTGSNAGVQVNLIAGSAVGGHAQGDTLTSIENLVGSAFDDILTGDWNANILEGGAGADTIDGEGGIDTASYASSSAKVTVRLFDGLTSGGDAAGDIISDVENLIGSRFSDKLHGDAQANRLEGGLGNDFLYGREGDDILIGGVGIDRLNGGGGADTFVFGAADLGTKTLQDFSTVSGDIIRLDPAQFTDFADVMSATTDVAGSAVISRGGLTITITGVTKAQLSSGDFEFAVAAPPLGGGKDGALTLPGLGDDDPLILPQDFGPLTKGQDNALILPPLDDGLDPLILPAGLEGKTLADEAPVICPPGDLDSVSAPQRPTLDVGDLSNFGGRDPHRFLITNQPVDWII